MSTSPARCRWTAKGQNGEVAAWAGGDGIGIATQFDPARPWFGDEGPEKRGPAVLVQFTVEREDRAAAPLTVDAWIHPSEIEQLEESPS